MNVASTLGRNGRSQWPGEESESRLMPMPKRMTPSGAFTLLELLVVIGIIALLAAMLVPGLSRAKTRAQAIHCMNNLKQLQLAWQLYADDHDDWIVPNAPWEWDSPECYWVRGKMSYGLDNTDNTNTAYLTGGYLGPYHRSAAIFKDPADQSVADIDGRLHPRARTVAMNHWMGTCLGTWWSEGRVFLKTTQIVTPPPSAAFVFILQREDAIEDAWFLIEMDQGRSVNWPGAYHNRGENLSFADGHVEKRNWVDARTTPPLERGEPLDPGPVWNNDNPDINWLRARATSRHPSTQARYDNESR